MNEEIIKLEIRYTHLEKFVQELNVVVTEQQKTIDRLNGELMEIKSSLFSDSGVEGSRTLKDDKPPHY